MTATGIHVCAENHSGEAPHTSGPTGWLHLAAAPTFATMALLNALAVAPADILCSAVHGMASIGGMTLMYALMCVFHAGPWWKLLAAQRNRRRCAMQGGHRRHRTNRRAVPALQDIGFPRLRGVLRPGTDPTRRPSRSASAPWT